MNNQKTFNNNDYNSKDGMLTTVWGPSLWHSLHTISFNYPTNPTSNKNVDTYHSSKVLDIFFHVNIVEIITLKI